MSNGHKPCPKCGLPGGIIYCPRCMGTRKYGLRFEYRQPWRLKGAGKPKREPKEIERVYSV
jgi:uncharacterized Zn finger protein (UPF0148 family)